MKDDNKVIFRNYMGKYSKKEATQIIEQALREGKTQAEIETMTGRSVGFIRKVEIDLIRDGTIILKEIEKAKFERIKNFFAEDYRMNVLIDYIRAGFSEKEIAELLRCNLDKIEADIKRLVKYELISQEEVDRANQALRETSNQPNSRLPIRPKMKKEEKRNTIAALLKQGYSYQEIMETLGIYKEGIKNMKEEEINQGRLTEHEYSRAKKARRDILEEDQPIVEEELMAADDSADKRAYELYQADLQRAQKIYEGKIIYPDVKINSFIQKLILEASKMQKLGKIKKEEITMIRDALFEAIKIDINNVLGIAKLYISEKDYHNSIYVLNQAKQFANGPAEIEQLNKAVKTIIYHKRKVEAAEMIRKKGHTVEEIERKTGLSLADILELKKRIEGTKQSIAVDAPGDDEFPDL